MVGRGEGFGAWASSSQASYPPHLAKPSESFTHSANVDLGVRHLTTFAHSLVFDGKFREKTHTHKTFIAKCLPSSRIFQNLQEQVSVRSIVRGTTPGLTHLVVSLNRGTLIYTPKYDHPYYKDPQRGTPNFGKPSTSVIMRRSIFLRGTEGRPCDTGQLRNGLGVLGSPWDFVTTYKV